MTDPWEELLKENMQQEVNAYLDQLSQIGAKISVEGYALPLKQVAKLIALSEGICYMPDFLTNEDGELIEIRFDRVRLT